MGLVNQYGLDILQVPDHIEVGHLPKIESYPDYTFLILRAYIRTPIRSGGALISTNKSIK
jgi:hypothetical protein